MPKYYIVGGYVRDKLLGIKSKDVDFSVEASSYEEMKEDLLKKGVKIYLETPEYFTIRGSHPIYGGVDYVLCRRDGEYIDGRHPESVIAGTILDDLARRDFTINAMAIDENEQLIDPFDGRVDLESKTIKAVGNPYDRFKEDSLRILRAIRFAVKYGFIIEQNTLDAMHTKVQTIVTLPEERVREELDKCFRIDTIMTLEYLHFLGITDIIFGNTEKWNLWLMPTNKDR